MSAERTYRREDLVDARRRWAEGEFGNEWAPYRALAAKRGFIHPPTGSQWDSWEDPQPSQRAIVYRAIEDTPTLLRRAIGESRSWGEVVRVLLRELDGLRDAVSLAEQDLVIERETHTWTKREAAERIGSIVGRLR